MAIISALLPLAIQLVGWFLNRSAASAETKKRYLEWVRLFGQETKSAKLSQWVDEQMKEFAGPFTESK